MIQTKESYNIPKPSCCGSHNRFYNLHSPTTVNYLTEKRENANNHTGLQVNLNFNSPTERQVLCKYFIKVIFIITNIKTMILQWKNTQDDSDI